MIIRLFNSYFSIILTVMVTALLGGTTEPQTGWFYDQSTQQSFYFIEEITIDGLVVEGDGTGEEGECYTSGTCDVVGAFRRGVCDDPEYQNSQQLCELFSVWNTDEEICIGWRYADSEDATVVPLMGKEGAEGDNTFTYANGGESAYLKVYDSSNGSTLDLIPSAELPGWELNGFLMINGTSTANNTFGCTAAEACNYDANATVDDGSCLENDCAGECGGSAVEDECTPELFDYNTSLLQAFYFFTTVTINGAAVEPDDWVGAFNGEICVGARRWGDCDEGSCDVPAMGVDGSEYTMGYMTAGVIPTFKIYDTSNDEYLDAIPSEDYPWATNGMFVVNSLENAISGSTVSLEIQNVNIDNGTLDIYMVNSEEVGSFQFQLTNIEITGASGGTAFDAGLTISTGGNTVLAISFSGATILAGSGVLVQVSFIDYYAGSEICFGEDTGSGGMNAIFNAGAVYIAANWGACYSGQIILGCMDMDACNHNPDATEPDGCTYAEENYDCDGNCIAELDCAGVCGGGSIVDGINCGGVSIGIQDVDPDAGTLDIYMTNYPGCSYCEDPSYNNNSYYWWDMKENCEQNEESYWVYYDPITEAECFAILSNDDNGGWWFDGEVAGFQFQLFGATIDGTWGGSAEDNEFIINTQTATYNEETNTQIPNILGFTFSGATIPAGAGVLVSVFFSNHDGDFCFGEDTGSAGATLVSGSGGDGYSLYIGATWGPCYDPNCPSGIYDCAGECGGSAVVDECGVCGGNGSSCGTTVTDIDGNVYQTVQIGEQLWMAENMKVTHYNDGSEIPTGYSDYEWQDLQTGAYAVYPTDNDEASQSTCGDDCAAVYGNLYNWHAVDDSRGVCPDGWHIPSDEEYTILTDYLGDDAGGKMKEAGLEHWNSPNTGATNESGFTAFPAGNRDRNNGYYSQLGKYGYFWSSSQAADYNAFMNQLYYDNSGMYPSGNSKNDGFSIRCVEGEDVDCSGVPGGSAIEDCFGECGGNAIEDCSGDCGGWTLNLGCGCGELFSCFDNDSDLIGVWGQISAIYYDNMECTGESMDIPAELLYANLPSNLILNQNGTGGSSYIAEHYDDEMGDSVPVTCVNDDECTNPHEGYICNEIQPEDISGPEVLTLLYPYASEEDCMENGECSGCSFNTAFGSSAECNSENYCEITMSSYLNWATNTDSDTLYIYSAFGVTSNFGYTMNEDNNLILNPELDIEGNICNVITFSMEDCAGVIGGDAMEDACGICNGFNAVPELLSINYPPNTFFIDDDPYLILYKGFEKLDVTFSHSLLSESLGGIYLSSSIGSGFNESYWDTEISADDHIIDLIVHQFASSDILELTLDWKNIVFSDCNYSLDSTTVITINTQILGDYDQNNYLDGADIQILLNYWNDNISTEQFDEDNYNIDLAPVELPGMLPHFISTPDGEWNLDDLMAFIRVWNYYNIDLGREKITHTADFGQPVKLEIISNQLNMQFPDFDKSMIRIWFQLSLSGNETSFAVADFGQQFDISLETNAGENVHVWDLANLGTEMNLQSLVLGELDGQSKNPQELEFQYQVISRDGMLSSGTMMIEYMPLPDDFELSQAYPNPFNPVTTLQYALPVESAIVLSVYDIQGRLVAYLANELKSAGYYEAVWNASNHASGMYFIRMNVYNSEHRLQFSKMQKIILVK